MTGYVIFLCVVYSELMSWALSVMSDKALFLISLQFFFWHKQLLKNK